MNDPILILGGGHQGLSMAAHLALNGEKVHLWNRTRGNIASVMASHSIVAKGLIDGIAKINKVSDDLPSLMTTRIMITTPAAAHKPLAQRLAPLLQKDSVVVLNPGRTFGAREFQRVLSENKCQHMPSVAETQTIVYTCRRSKENEVYIYGLKKGVAIASVESNDMPKIFNALPFCLHEYFTPAKSLAETSLSNVGMILHCAPMLMNIGWIEHETAEFIYYYEGISPTIASFLEKLDAERLAVAAADGCQVESVMDWLKRVYQVKGDNLYQCLHNNFSYKTIDAPRSLRHRYIEDDIPYGLVPIESAGIFHNVPTPLTTSLITIANSVMNVDYRVIGRHY